MPKTAKLCMDFKTLTSGKACEQTFKSDFVYLWASQISGKAVSEKGGEKG